MILQLLIGFGWFLPVFTKSWFWVRPCLTNRPILIFNTLTIRSMMLVEFLLMLSSVKCLNNWSDVSIKTKCTKMSLPAHSNL